VLRYVDEERTANSPAKHKLKRMLKLKYKCKHKLKLKLKLKQQYHSTKLRWTPSLGQDRSCIKSGFRCPYGACWY